MLGGHVRAPTGPSRWNGRGQLGRRCSAPRARIGGLGVGRVRSSPATTVDSEATSCSMAGDAVVTAATAGHHARRISCLCVDETRRRLFHARKTHGSAPVSQPSALLVPSPPFLPLPQLPSSPPRCGSPASGPLPVPPPSPAQMLTDPRRGHSAQPRAGMPPCRSPCDPPCHGPPFRCLLPDRLRHPLSIPDWCADGPMPIHVDATKS